LALASLDHVFGDARLRDFQPELEQFAMDARRSPKRILDAHPPDQHTEVFSICGRPPRERDFQRRQGRDDQNEAKQCKHCPPTSGDSVSQSNPDLVFGTQRGAQRRFQEVSESKQKTWIEHEMTPRLTRLTLDVFQHRLDVLGGQDFWEGTRDHNVSLKVLADLCHIAAGLEGASAEPTNGRVQIVSTNSLSIVVISR
jgi:hypothetical protein